MITEERRAELKRRALQTAGAAITWQTSSMDSPEYCRTDEEDEYLREEMNIIADELHRRSMR